jgi:hypothetical protein
MARSQPVADERVAGAYDEKADSGEDEGEIKHDALLFENAKIVMSA